jgi:hypothetical protein
LWGPKNGLQQMPPLYNAYGAEVLRNKFYKDKPKTKLPKQIWLKLDWSETCLLQQSSSTWNPIWRFPLFKRNMRSHLATSK